MPADPPSIPIPRWLLGLRPPLRMGAKTYTKAEGSKIAEGRIIQAVLYPSSDAEASFLALTHLPPSPNAGTSAGHR